MILPREIKLASKVRTPRTIHKFVLELVEKIGSGFSPIWVQVRPAKGALPGECFFNVPEQIKIKGGGIRYGWTVWQCANLFIEGEFHAVWVSPQGDLFDPTPKDDGETRILFVPDDRQTWQGIRVPNIHHALVDGPEVRDFLKTVIEQMEFLKRNAVPNSPNEIYDPHGDWQRLETEKGRLTVGMSKYVAASNASCFCESGRHFGNCCGKL